MSHPGEEYSATMSHLGCVEVESIDRHTLAMDTLRRFQLSHLLIGIGCDSSGNYNYSIIKSSFSLLCLVWVSPSSSALIPCQRFMETCTGDLDKSYTNKAYQEKEERYNMKNENQCIL
jgi:hypothetical protein